MFLYSAFDIDFHVPRYSQECMISILSLRRFSKKKVRVYTNNPIFFEDKLESIHILDLEVVYIKNCESPKEMKIKSMLDASGSFIYLDTHTIVLDNLDFFLMELSNSKYKIAGASAPWRENMKSLSPNVVKNEIAKDCEINTGVIFSTGDNKLLFQTWLDEYKKVRDISETPYSVKDQPAFKKACFKTKVNVLKLPNNYNFRANFGGVVSGKVYVYHSHYGTNLAQIIRSGLQLEEVYEFIKMVEKINNSTKTYNYPSLLQKELISTSTLDRSIKFESL